MPRARHPDRRTWAEKQEAERREVMVEMRERRRKAEAATEAFGEALRRERLRLLRERLREGADA